MKQGLIKAGIVTTAVVVGATVGVLAGKGLSILAKDELEPAVDPETFEEEVETIDEVGDGELQINQEE